MNEEKKSFVNDTINLDEIRMLLGEISEPAETILPEESAVETAAPQQSEAEVYVPEQPTEDVSVSSQTVGPDENPDVSDVDEDDGVEIPSFMQEADSEEEPSAVLPEDEAASVPEPVSEDVDLPDDALQKEGKKSSALHELHFLLHDVVYLLLAVTLVFVFCVRLVGVKGDSMMPTLWNKDFLLLESNFLYKGDDIQYGDIVVLNVPYYQEKGEGPIVKRVIATEGQTVNIDFESGAVYVDGVMLSETYINEPTTYNWDGTLGLQYPAVVPENCIFVLGDNRNNSMDSRFASIGMIDERCVLGKVLLIAIPGQVEDDYGNVIKPREWGRIGLVS